MRRSLSALLVVSALALSACRDPGAPVAPNATPRLAISDGSQPGGDAHFFFLPPIGQNRAYTGAFDASAAPIVRVCRWTGTACDGQWVAEYTRTGGTGGETIDVFPATGQYRVDWPTVGLPPGSIYRIHVILDGAVVAFADAKVVAAGDDPATLRAQGYVPLGNSSILAVRFRIEEGAGEPATVTVEPATTSVAVGSAVQLTATARNAIGNPLPGVTFDWESSDETIARVSPTGLVTGVAEGGPVTIIASTGTSGGDVSGTASVRVTRPLPPPICGALLPGSIASAAEVDDYRFSGTAGHFVTVTLAETAGFGGFGQAPRVSLIAPSNTIVNPVFDANGQRNYTLQETGIYVLRVTANDLVGTGSYSLGFECISPPSPDAIAIGYGSLVSGDIVPAEVDLFTFSGTAGQFITVTLAETAGFGGFGQAPRVCLIAPSNAIVDCFDANAQRNYALTETGTYVLRVNANDFVGSGSYSLGLEGIRPASPDAVGIGHGSLVSGTITPAKVDLYTFGGMAGHFITVTLAETAGFGGFGQAPRVCLIAPSNTVVDCFDANAQRNYTLEETGTYVLRVNANDYVGSGSYTLGLEGIRPPSPDAVGVGYGSLVGGSITPAKVDLYTFPGTSGHFITVTLAETGGFGGFGQAPRVCLIAPSNTVVECFDANGQRSYTLSETGTYVLRVNANDFVGSGSYSLGLEGIRPASPDAVAISCGNLPSGGIVAAEVDLYTFTGTAGQFITVTLAETAGFGGFGQAPRVNLIAPSNTVVDPRFDANAQHNYKLTETGTYVLRVNANDFVGAGSYSLSLECISPPSPDAVAIGYGSLVSGGIVAAEVDLFTFTGTAGHFVTVTLAETAGFGGFGQAPRVCLIAPSNAIVDCFDANAQRNYALTETGTYVLRVNANDFVGAGSYSLGLEGIRPPSPDAVGIGHGSLVSGAITPAKVDLYTFTGAVGHFITVTLAETAGFGGFGQAPRVCLIAPSNAVVECFDANAQRNYTLAEAGTYVLRVNANDYVGSGSYTLGLEGVRPPSPDATPIDFGSPVSGGIVAAEVDLHTFTGTPGQSITVTLAETAGFGGFGQAPRVCLIAPSNTVVQCFDANGQRNYTLAESGTYVLRVNANDFVGAGSYNLGLTSP
jgi:hypothetical protein